MENLKNDYLDKSLALLAKYLKETPQDILAKQVEEIESMNFEGVTVEKYLVDFDSHFEIFNNSYKLIDTQNVVSVGKNSYQINGRIQTYSGNGTVASNENESFVNNYQYAMAA